MTKLKGISGASTLVIVAAGCLTLAPPLGAQSALASFEDTEREVCRGDAAWLRSAAIRHYFEESFRDLDRHFSAFLRSGDEAMTATGDPDGAQLEERMAAFARLHEQAQALIPRLGRLLPRMNRPLDLNPMIAQMQAREIREPFSEHSTEFLRVVLAREMLEVSADPPALPIRDPGLRISAFLIDLSAVENSLFDLAGGESDEKTIEALKGQFSALAAAWRNGFRPIAEKTIFRGSPANFGERIAMRVKAMCEARGE